MSDQPQTPEANDAVAKAQSHTADAIQEIKDNYQTMLQLRDKKIARLEKELEELRKKGAPAPPRGRLLIIDDAESLKELCEQYLANENLTWVCVNSQQVEEQLSLPHDAWMIESSASIQKGMDGVAMALRLCSKGKGDKVVLLSSRPGDAHKDQVVEAGGHFLRKPFRRSDFLQAINTLFPKETV